MFDLHSFEYCGVPLDYYPYDAIHFPDGHECLYWDCEQGWQACVTAGQTCGKIGVRGKGLYVFICRRCANKNGMLW
jgi:hypothetical protein